MVHESIRSLALYHFEQCPYCRLVRREIDRLGIAVELRDIHREPQHLRELLAARGRRTVPVLRITAGEQEHWMPESRDIVRFLQEHHGASKHAGESAPIRTHTFGGGDAQLGLAWDDVDAPLERSHKGRGG